MPASSALEAPPITITAVEQSALAASLTSKPILKDFSVSHSTSATISSGMLTQCLGLVELTSAAAYKGSSVGWSSRKKRVEMEQEGMRYLVLRRNAAQETTTNSGTNEIEIAGFLSYLPTVEPDPDFSPPEIPVLYVFEVHVHPSQQGRGIGGAMMSIGEEIAAAMGMKKTMLTVFTSNEAGLRFYERLGYEKWDEEVLPKRRIRLRKAEKEMKPSYVILAKDMKGR